MLESSAASRCSIAVPGAKPRSEVGACSIRVVESCCVSEARSIVNGSDAPVLFRGMIDRWPARTWTPKTFAAEYGDVSTLFRVHRRPSSDRSQGGVDKAGAVATACEADPRIVWEGDCSYCHATFSQFFSWTDSVGSDPTKAGALAAYDSSISFAYADYKYMHQLFADRPDALAAVDWAQSFGQQANGSDSTLWLGSRGACTQCHQDSYGANLVAQLFGKKRWTLYPPSAGSRGLYPTRVPYEQSSVFSRVDVHNPDLSRHPQFRAVAHEVKSVTLQPGEVLFVPKHWWHDVQTVSEIALSVNHWIQLRSDGRERVKEALVAVLAAALMPPQGDNHSQQPEASQTPALWLNPGEDQVTVGEAVEMLSQAVTAYHGQDDPTRVRAADDKPAGCQVDIDRTRMFARVVNALGTGGALEAAADAVLDIGPTQQTLTSVAQIPEGDLSSFLPEAMNYSPRDQHINVVVGQQKTMDDLKNAQHRNWLVRTLVSSKQEDTALLCVEHLGGEECEFLFDEVFTQQAYLGGGWLKLQSPFRETNVITIVDCGANIGLFSLWCVSQCRSAAVEVVAIEPAPPCCEVLRRNLAAYTTDRAVDKGNPARVHVVPCGLVGPQDTTVAEVADMESGITDVFLYNPARPGETHRRCHLNEADSQRRVMGSHTHSACRTTSVASLSADTGPPDDAMWSEMTFEAKTKTLSAVLWGKGGLWPSVGEGCEGGRRRIDLLKIDVEGDELEVLRGILAADWPLIGQVALEVHNHGGKRLGEVVSLLESVGFAVRTEAQQSSVSDQGYLAVIPSALQLFYVFARREDQVELSVSATTCMPLGTEEERGVKRFKASAI